MDCQLIDDKWVAFHLGESGSDRPLLEAHLMDCSFCLKSFLAVKRQEEVADNLGWEPPPSPVKKLPSQRYAVPFAAAVVAASVIWMGTWALKDPAPDTPVEANTWAGAEPSSHHFL